MTKHPDIVTVLEASNALIEIGGTLFLVVPAIAFSAITFGILVSVACGGSRKGRL